jgi:hypothetical protein
MENYNQLCVWPGTLVGGTEGVKEFESFMLETFNARVKYHTEIRTRPDIDEEGNEVPDTGDRNDLFFYVHDDDVLHFAVPRLQVGIRWWEDVVGYNNNRHLYPEDFIEAHPLTW